MKFPPTRIFKGHLDAPVQTCFCLLISSAEPSSPRVRIALPASITTFQALRSMVSVALGTSNQHYDNQFSG